MKHGEFHLKHKFKAPRKLVFEAFSKAEALGEWWGPVQCKNSVVSLDFRVGGVFHFRMEAGGEVSYGRMLFTKIQPHHTLEFSNAFADEYANVVPAPGGIKLPLEILYLLRFSEAKGITTIDLTGKPLNATEEEVRTFGSIKDSMEQGFTASFEKLETYLNQPV